MNPQHSAPLSGQRRDAGGRVPNPVAGAPVPEHRTVTVAARITPTDHTARPEKAVAGVSDHLASMARRASC